MDNRQALIFHGVKAAGVVDSGSSAMNGPEGMGLPFTAGSQITTGSIIFFRDSEIEAAFFKRIR